MDGGAMAAHYTSSDMLLVPSINFNVLCPGVFRSGYPTKKNFPFLRTLGLRSICYLCPEEYAQPNQKFCEEQGITLARFPMEGNKEPFVDIPELTVHRTLSFLADPVNHPVLIHCNKGKHRTGTICGCLRRLQGWSMVSIFQEYVRFAGDKARSGDQQFIELYHPVLLVRPGPTHSVVASWVDMCYHGRAYTLTSDEATFAAIVAHRSQVSLLGNGQEAASAAGGSKKTQPTGDDGKPPKAAVGGKGVEAMTPLHGGMGSPAGVSALRSPRAVSPTLADIVKEKKDKKENKAKEVAT
jgi:tyrosine-protein phosphatase SIW14